MVVNKKTGRFFAPLFICVLGTNIWLTPLVAENQAIARSANAAFSIELINTESELGMIDSLLSKVVSADADDLAAQEDEQSGGVDLSSLYEDNWDNNYVHPYKNVQIPDSLVIDCSAFVMPTAGYVTSKFGPRRRRMHNGIDLKVYKGDTIASAFEGKVRIAKYMRGYGKVVVLRHNNGLESIYGHLSKITVAVDQEVKGGECIGLGGSTGRSTGTHLHFEVRVLGKPINPSDIFDFENNVLKSEQYVFNSKRSPYDGIIYTNTAYHRVRSGETLGLISKRYKVPIAELCRINRLRQTSVLSIGQIVRLNPSVTGSTGSTQKPVVRSTAPAPRTVAQADKTTSEKTTANRATSQPLGSVHVVKKGDTLGKIAAEYGLSIENLCNYNGITRKTVIDVGDKILLSGGSVAMTKSEPSKQAAEILSHHVVRSGDTLSKISAKYGVSIDKICTINGISRNTTLRLGQKLKFS